MTPEREALLVQQLKEAAAAGETRTAARDEAHLEQMLFMCLCFEYEIEFKPTSDQQHGANMEKSRLATQASAELAKKVEGFAHMGADTMTRPTFCRGTGRPINECACAAGLSSRSKHHSDHPVGHAALGDSVFLATYTRTCRVLAIS